MKIQKNLPLTFAVAFLISALLFGIDGYVSNRVGSNQKEIITGVIAAVLALPFFIIGIESASRVRANLWVILNSLAIMIIVGWTIWISYILYTFKDFHL